MFVNPPVLQRLLLRSLIDHVIASKGIPALNLLQPCGLSDRKMQVASFELGTVKHLPNIRYVRSFRRCDSEKLRDALHSAPWQTKNVFDDVNDKWFYFCTLLQNCFDKFLPLKRVTVHKARRPTPWFNDNISASMWNKNKLLKGLDLIWIEISIANLK